MTVLFVAESILPLINGIQAVTYFLYSLALTLGHIIVSAIIKTFNFGIEVSITTNHVLHVLQEDFDIFKNDLFDVSVSIGSCAAEIAKSYTFVQQCYSIILSFFQILNEALKTLFHLFIGLKLFLEKTCILVLDSLCFIGSAFICCIDIVGEIFSFETYIRLTDIIVNKTAHIVKQEVFLGFFLVLCLTSISYVHKIHLKVVKLMELSLYKLGTVASRGLIVVLLITGAVFKSVEGYWRTIKKHFVTFVLKKKNLTKINNSDLQILLEQEKAEKLCVVCMDHKRNTILLDCQHLVLCNICLSVVLQDKSSCPVCRSIIRDAIMVYT